MWSVRAAVNGQRWWPLNWARLQARRNRRERLGVAAFALTVLFPGFVPEGVDC